jgi:hypothetical protein
MARSACKQSPSKPVMWVVRWLVATRSVCWAMPHSLCDHGSAWVLAGMLQMQ